MTANLWQSKEKKNEKRPKNNHWLVGQGENLLPDPYEQTTEALKYDWKIVIALNAELEVFQGWCRQIALNTTIKEGVSKGGS